MMSVIQGRDCINNCAVRERTADGKSVGRCYLYLEHDDNTYECSRHGDVTAIRKHYIDSGELSEDHR